MAENPGDYLPYCARASSLVTEFAVLRSLALCVRERERAYVRVCVRVCARSLRDRPSSIGRCRLSGGDAIYRSFFILLPQRRCVVLLSALFAVFADCHLVEGRRNTAVVVVVVVSTDDTGGVDVLPPSFLPFLPLPRSLPLPLSVLSLLLFRQYQGVVCHSGCADGNISDRGGCGRWVGEGGVCVVIHALTV